MHTIKQSTTNCWDWSQQLNSYAKQSQHFLYYSVSLINAKASSFDISKLLQWSIYYFQSCSTAQLSQDIRAFSLILWHHWTQWDDWDSYEYNDKDHYIDQQC